MRLVTSKGAQAAPDSDRRLSRLLATTAGFYQSILGTVLRLANYLAVPHPCRSALQDLNPTVPDGLSLPGWGRFLVWLAGC